MARLGRQPALSVDEALRGAHINGATPRTRKRIKGRSRPASSLTCGARGRSAHVDPDKIKDNPRSVRTVTGGNSVYQACGERALQPRRRMG